MQTMPRLRVGDFCPWEPRSLLGVQGYGKPIRVPSIIKSPHNFSDAPRPWVFLAGSIEMGAASDWRGKVAEEITNEVTLLNPWRDDWDDSWRQSIEDENFRGQVEWELGALEGADAVLMYFEPGTTAPISLLEFGLFAGSGKLVVCCPDGFWRKGNVDAVCRRYGVPETDSLDDALSAVRAALGPAEGWR